MNKFQIIYKILTAIDYEDYKNDTAFKNDLMNFDLLFPFIGDLSFLR
jgi:hypothetical protein